MEYCKVLVIGFLSEGTFCNFINNLREMDKTFSLVDLNDIKKAKVFDVSIENDSLHIKIDEKEYEIGGGSIYYRGFFKPNLNENSHLTFEFFSRLESCLQIISSKENFYVFNPPLSYICNTNKFIHQKNLSKVGFSMPPAILSNSVSSLKKSIAPNNKWINKGVSGIRTEVVSVSGFECHRLPLLKNAPSLFQKRIIGYDVRVHFIQSKYLAQKIIADKVDYRYCKRNGGTLQITEVNTPEAIKFLCIEYMRTNNTRFSGFDFKVDSDNKWWLLEVNPMPGFEFFDLHCDGKLSRLLAEALFNPNLEFNNNFNLEVGMFIPEERLPSLDLG